MLTESASHEVPSFLNCPTCGQNLNKEIGEKIIEEVQYNNDNDMH